MKQLLRGKFVSVNDSYVDNILQKHIFSVFRAEVRVLESG
jgi:hypothetical protein